MIRPSSNFLVISVSLLLLVAFLDDGYADDALRNAVIHSKSSKEAGRAYGALFTSSDAHALTNDKNLGIALQAYWRINHVQTVLRSGEPDGDPPELSVNPLRLSETHVNRFLGFFEGRTHIRVPAFWEEALLNWQYWPSEQAQAEAEFFQGELGISPAKLNGLRLCSGINLRKDNDMVMIDLDPTQEKDEARLPIRVFDIPSESFPEPNSCDVEIHATLAVVAMYHSDISEGYVLRGVDIRSGKVLWENKGWGAGREGGGGSFYNYLQVRIQDALVIAFGESATGRYAEAFDCSSGEAIFHFSTNYWNAWDKKPQQTPPAQLDSSNMP
jgi:hypothetical protein